MACCECACMNASDIRRCLSAALATVGVGLSESELTSVSNLIFNCAKECE